MFRYTFACAGLIATLALTSGGGCRSCSNCHDYDPPCANCDCNACGTQRAGSVSCGCATCCYNEGDEVIEGPGSQGDAIEAPAMEGPFIDDTLPEPSNNGSTAAPTGNR